MRHGAKGSDFYFSCIVKIHCILNYLKYNGIFLLQNDKSYFTCVNFESNPPSTVNTAKFDFLDLSGPPCIGCYEKRHLLRAWFLLIEGVRKVIFQIEIEFVINSLYQQTDKTLV